MHPTDRPGTRLTVEHWPIIAGVSVTAAAGLWLLARRRPRAEDRLTADARDPYRRWVQNVYLLVTTDRDYAHLSRAEASRILAHWWEVYGPIELHCTLQQLAVSGSPDRAWPLVRYVLVSRLGVAAGMLDEETSWDEILPIAHRLQRAYPSWRAMGQAYLQARRLWMSLPLDGSEDDDQMRQIVDNFARLDDTRWAELDFDTPLAATQDDSDG